MDFFVYSRDAAGAGALRDDSVLLEEHWSYMDRFSESMIARGPTLTPDGEAATGSLHVLGLPNIESVHAFLADEPNNRAGLYAIHSIWRFENLLGQTMWEFSGTHHEPKFLVVERAHDTSPPPVPLESLSRKLRERLIIYGALTTLDTAAPAGVALAVQASTSEAVDTLLREGRLELDVPAGREIYRWAFGGRPDPMRCT